MSIIKRVSSKMLIILIVSSIAGSSLPLPAAHATEESFIYSGDNSAVERVVASLRAGDLIKYSTDVSGRISNIKLLFSVSDLDRFYRANPNGSEEEIYGLAYDIGVRKLAQIRNEIVDKLTVTLGSENNNVLVNYELLHKNGAPSYLYDTDKKTIQSAQGYDILSVAQAGDSASKVFMLVNNNTPEVLVVIK